MQIAINQSLIDTILVILFPSIPRRPWFERRIFHLLKYSARADPALLRARRMFQCYARGERRSLVRDRNGADLVGTRAIANFRWSLSTGIGEVFTCQFRPRVSPIFSKAVAMSAVRFLKGRWPHFPSRLRARQTPG